MQEYMEQKEQIFKKHLPVAENYKQALLKFTSEANIQNTIIFPIEIGHGEDPHIIKLELKEPLRYDGNFGIIQDVIEIKEQKPLTVKTSRLFFDGWPNEIALLSKIEPHINVVELLNYSKSIHKSLGPQSWEASIFSVIAWLRRYYRDILMMGERPKPVDDHIMKQAITWMNIFLEYFGTTLRDLINEYEAQQIPQIYVKVYMLHLLRGLGHLHSYNICHRNITPENILIDKKKRFLKIANLECSEQLPEGKGIFRGCEITTYAAPELLLLTCYYSLSIDVWSTGCILGELLNKNNLLISGSTEVEIFHSIRRLLGSPKLEDVIDMGFPAEVYEVLKKKKKFPTLRTIYANVRPEEIEILEELLQYSPLKRPTPLSLLGHKFFSKLRDPTVLYPNGETIPDLFKFTERELEIQPELESICTNHS